VWLILLEDDGAKTTSPMQLGNQLTTLRIILGDQLNPNISSLDGLDVEKDIVLMCEVWDETKYVKHHKKKIAFLFSAMRHFAEDLRAKNINLVYYTLATAPVLKSFTHAIKEVLKTKFPTKIIVTFPGEYRVLTEIKTWTQEFNLPVDIRADARFLCSLEDFNTWAEGRKSLRMEYFYREMRKKFTILMDGDQPVGGQWNYDIENRKPPKPDFDVPQTYLAAPDDITNEVITLVEKEFSDHIGNLGDFHFAVTHSAAKQALHQFIDERLKYFGDFQDAMVEGQPWMFHAHVGLYLNCGLLSPLDCIQAAEQAYYDRKAPLNAVEGFIRQILGWREFVRGIYWREMPEYALNNFFEAKRDLPTFYWDAKTEMNCLRQAVQETIDNAYAHHIQRLMILGNFALLAGLHPRQVNDWFLSVYADAFEWVELPNVSGMALFADGGLLASKPYASGGGYIKKMSNYCNGCRYKVSHKNGPDACPFNYLYWDFLDRNRPLLGNNHRVGMMYRVYDRMTDEKREEITSDSAQFLETLNQSS
tara:strand:- start:153 stop:1751 length:1599 start_codon:yes stop_codon:yes gene_type:complete